MSACRRSGQLIDHPVEWSCLRLLRLRLRLQLHCNCNCNCNCNLPTAMRVDEIKSLVMRL